VIRWKLDITFEQFGSIVDNSLGVRVTWKDAWGPVGPLTVDWMISIAEKVFGDTWYSEGEKIDQDGGYVILRRKE
jgi:hypothetical protein